MKQNKENRTRSKTINFWVTPDENALIETRVKITGMGKGEYLIKTLLEQKISISVGKFESDRLSIEIARLTTALEKKHVRHDDTLIILEECKRLLKELISILENSNYV